MSHEIVEQCLDKADHYIRAENYEMANKVLNKALKHDPENKDILLRMKLVESKQKPMGESNSSNPELRQRHAHTKEKTEPNEQSDASSTTPATASYTQKQVDIALEINGKTDLYEILCIEKTANADEIKKAYRKMVLKVHPDKNQAPGAEDAFKKVSEAYSILSNEEKRQIYDQQGMAGINPTSSSSNPEHYYGEMSPEDIFMQFFGMNSPFMNSGPYNSMPGFSRVYVNGRPMNFQRRHYYQHEEEENNDEHQNEERRTNRFTNIAMVVLYLVLMIFMLYVNSRSTSNEPTFSYYQTNSFSERQSTPMQNFYYTKPNTNNPQQFAQDVDIDGYRNRQRQCNIDYQQKTTFFFKPKRSTIPSCKNFKSYEERMKSKYPDLFE
ncbi:hypothetical protein WA158_007255 [Blastocystis sp. Blastoise]